MNKTLAFLEILGRDTRLARASGDELGTAARAAGVDPQLADALARRDLGAFQRLLSAVLLSAGLTLPPAAYALFVFSPAHQNEQAERAEEQASQAGEWPQQDVPQDPDSGTPPATPPSPDPVPDEPAPDTEPAGGSNDGEPATGTEADAGGNSGDEAAPQEDPDVPADDEAIDESADESIDEADGE